MINDVKMVMVVGDNCNGYVMYGTREARRDLDELGTRLLDDVGIDDPPECGIWIWEGKQKWTSYRGLEGDYDVDVTYHDGVYRKPTPEELSRIASGKAPWDEEPEMEDPDPDQVLDAGTLMAIGNPSPGEEP